MDVKAVVKNVIKKIFRIIFETILKISAVIFKLFPLKERVCFYSIRNNDSLLENAQSVYDKLDCEKIVLANMLPHSHLLIFKIYFYLLTSKVVVTDDYLKYLRYITLRKEQKVVQIWHACGAFKKFGLDAPLKMKREDEARTHSRYDAVCVSSEYVKDYYCSAFGISKDKIFATGVARTDKLFDKEYIEKTKEKIKEKYNFFNGKKIYLYTPTFREKNNQYIKFDTKIDFKKLSDSLNDDEVFVVKRHPVMKEPYFENNEFEKIYDLTNESVLDLMIVADTVVTDYSSVIFEAVLLGKKILFYCPDFEEYDRSFYISYPDELPGNVVKESSELLQEIRNSQIDSKTETFKNKELFSCDGHSAEKTAKLIIEFLK